MSNQKKPLRYYSVYEDELRMYNSANTTRKGKSRNGAAPKFFSERFSYKQPRRNDRGCGDLRITNTKTGETTTIHCDEVTKKFKFKKPPRHAQYNLRYDKSEEV